MSKNNKDYCTACGFPLNEHATLVETCQMYQDTLRNFIEVKKAFREVLESVNKFEYKYSLDNWRVVVNKAKEVLRKK